ncbi:MAG TPA: hypothetical protein VFC63_12220 [Blastocatellia bacterium]|nr:hypothetical protein [Blastocatellia bacterium]
MTETNSIYQAAFSNDVPDIKNDPWVISFERRLFRYLYATVGLTVLIGAIATRNVLLTAAIALGAALGIFNYRWMRSSLLVILGSGSSKPPQGTAFKFIWRYLVIAAIIFAALSIGHLNLAAIIAGLLAAMIGPPIAEAGYQFFTVIRDRNW